MSFIHPPLLKRPSLLVLTLVLLLPLACSDDKSATTETVATTAAVVVTDAPAATEAPTTTAAPEQWETVVAPSDCMCSDGSEFSFFVRKADPAKVMFFFQGGGACFDVVTCDPGDPAYSTTVRGPGDLADGEGIFDFDNADNPFGDYSVVYVPYCTGDLHIGNAVHDYGPGASGENVVVHHNGLVNGTTALAKLVELFPDASEVVVTGESAGAAPTPLYAGLLSDELPDARITVIADGSGAYPDLPSLNAGIGTLWGTLVSIPDWPEYADVTAETQSLPGLFIRAGAHDPDITFARHDYAFDQTQVFFGNLAGFDADDLVTLIDLNETQIEASGVTLFSYISPGDSHTVFGKPGFYTETLDGISLRDWVAALVAGTPVEDVHCTECN
ncbi:MAG: pectinacetylesterase family protein [Actinomycetia bacterium]|nr:pectinacetylesterase family protein [Actinomycetes bacterium]